MNASASTRNLSAAARIGLVALSVLSLLAGTRLAVFTHGPLRVLLVLLGFALFVLLFARALEGTTIDQLGPQRTRNPLDFGPPRT